jgi:Fanconi anemia group M protein
MASGVIELFSGEDVYLETKKLSFGDYVVNDTVTVERKTARDFLISIIDGRLFSQLSRLKNHSNCPVLLIEGNPFKTDLDFDPLAIRGALVSTQTMWYIPVLFSKTKEQTKDLLLMIARQDEVLTDVVQLRAGYRPKRLRTKQLYVLQGLPGVGPQIAKRLMHHFGTVSKVMAAPVAELMEVEGIGTKAAAKIRTVLDSP